MTIHSSHSVKCIISSYVVVFLVTLGTLSKMTLAAPEGVRSPYSSKSTETLHFDKVTSMVLSALIRATSRLCQRLPEFKKPPTPNSRLIKKLGRSIDNDSFFDDFD